VILPGGDPPPGPAAHAKKALDRSSLPELRPPGARLVAYLHLAFPLLRPFGRRPGEAAASLERRDERCRRPRTAHVPDPPAAARDRVPAVLGCQEYLAVGDQISLIALPLAAVLALRASPAEIGYLSALIWLPSLLFALHAEAWVDRHHPAEPAPAQDDRRGTLNVTA